MSASANIHTFICEESINTLVRQQRQELSSKMGVMVLFLAWSQTWFKWTKQAGFTGQPGTASTLHSLSSQNPSLSSQNPSLSSQNHSLSSQNHSLSSQNHSLSSQNQSLNIHSILDTHTKKKNHRQYSSPTEETCALTSIDLLHDHGVLHGGLGGGLHGDGPRSDGHEGRGRGGASAQGAGHGSAQVWGQHHSLRRLLLLMQALLLQQFVQVKAPTRARGADDGARLTVHFGHWGRASAREGAGLGWPHWRPTCWHWVGRTCPQKCYKYKIRISPFQGTKRLLQPG